METSPHRENTGRESQQLAYTLDVVAFSKLPYTDLCTQALSQLESVFPVYAHTLSAVVCLQPNDREDVFTNMSSLRGCCTLQTHMQEGIIGPS